MEINGKDAPGLLYRITRTIADLGVQIQTASVSTYGDRVVDVFYVKDSFGLKIERESRIKVIRETLLKVLEDSDPANQVAA
jgi:[protein-PII] uridylyltransferase